MIVYKLRKNQKVNTMKKTVLTVIAALAAVVVALWIRQGTYSRTEYMLNTVITITANNKIAVDECFEEIKRIENLLSAYLPDSDIWKINSSAVRQAVKVDSETVELLERCAEYKKATYGMFDISIKPVLDSWNISGGGNIPEDDEIQEAVALIGDVIADKYNFTVTLPKDGMAIDLGGIAKGYAADRVTEILKAYGVKSAIADLGGNISVIGKKGNRDWKIGLQHPEKARGNTFAYVEVQDQCVVTSGGYERYFERDGERYHHIIDPATGKNPKNGVESVTVIAKDGALADALSTALYIAGSEKGLQLAEKLGVKAVFYTDKGIISTDGVDITLNGDRMPAPYEQ